MLAALPPNEPEVVPRSGIIFEVMPLTRPPPDQACRKPDGRFATLTRAQILAELRTITEKDLHERGDGPLHAPLPRLSCRFETYGAVDHRWFTAFARWVSHDLFRHFGLSYRKESLDCDNYSLTLNAFADIAQIESPTQQPPHLIGRMIVYQRFPWANVPAAFSHELVIFRSGKGWFVLEPQNGFIVALARYPNRETIMEVLLN